MAERVYDRRRRTLGRLVDHRPVEFLEKCAGNNLAGQKVYGGLFIGIVQHPASLGLLEIGVQLATQSGCNICDPLDRAYQTLRRK